MGPQAVATNTLSQASRGLSAVLQPIVDLTSGRVVGVESLARFADERPPDAHFAEATTASSKLALELAAVGAGLARFGEVPPDAYLTLNVSPETAISSELALILAGAPAGRVVLELTEHAPIGDYATLERGLSALRARGFRVAVDDAGAGFASMRHVLALRPDVIKLDISIVRGIDGDSQRREFVRALVSFSHATSCTLVAEGIETQEELAAIRGLGVGCGQGFWLGRPQRAVAGPWQLKLPPLHGSAHRARPRGRFGRIARPAGVLLAAAIAWPSIVAVAGWKAPPAGGMVGKSPAAVESHGGSAATLVRAPGPATARRPHDATIVTTAVVRSSQTASAQPTAKKSGVVTTTVDTLVGGGGQIVGGVLNTTEHVVSNVLGGLLGGRRAPR